MEKGIIYIHKNVDDIICEHHKDINNVSLENNQDIS